MRRAAKLVGRCLAVALPVLASGCRVGPDYRPPDMSAITEAPWRAGSLDAGAPRVSAGTVAADAWWRQFDDEELSRLIDLLARQNLTLEEARQRVLAARAIREEVAAARRPQVDATAEAREASTGSEAVNFRGPPPGQSTEFYAAGLSAAWELDLWGRVGRLARAADANVEVSVEDYRAAAVSLTAELATAYTDLRTLQARTGLLDRNIELLRQALALVESEQEAGAANRRDVARAQRQLSQTLALRPALREAAACSENRMAVLLGRRPGDVVVGPGGMPRMPAMIGLGLPADLIARRADVRRAIAAYRAAVERLGASEAERYPTVTLAGTLNVQSSSAADLFGGHAITYDFGPRIRLPLLDGGRVDAAVRERVAQAEERRVAAERTLLEAIGEVENAAVGVARSDDRLGELAAAVAAARTEADVADQLHRTGLSDLLQVVEAQRTIVELEDRSLLARRDALAGAVQLYRALGGGWESLPLPEPRPAAVSEHAMETTP